MTMTDESMSRETMDAPAMATVRFEPDGVEVVMEPDETILEAGLRAGIAIPCSCCEGMCGTCRMQKLSGEVDMQQNGALFDDEVEAGEILACCSRPLGAVVVRLP
ncbi:CDP-6-deoxy-L-threo-D-glycero-4-hexulose-3-dehydrase reductase [Hartmannibacter diazotrophicus]|uniref:CDP-6-deoxy-L-threo-D-glycero-4-hexulose-3-dehydrase reductase n=1 Tax=Hartmannibacter diazotrophicus TaxID=1482074 RepID=A0A2C9DCK2_9HYPH|nr:2Fe-2S iron-sulfur cluster-binding protein [Hartmannibacter diazotrophicus]SON58027.1 CDP-6-deoxy-L-threo-D-glycero-4-hexulose-3-dehydrase reductase [Hartmannibacter diazotrophicus]